MPIKTVTSFEVLCQPIAPVPNVPFVQQGAFLQVSNLEAKPVTIDIEYIATPAFTNPGSGPITLFANIITQTGIAKATSYPAATFVMAPVGFKKQDIPAHTTWLFGVQYLITPGMTPASTASLEARGFLQINAAKGTQLLVLATTRQVFTNYAPDGPPGTVIDLSESAYPVPVVGGPELSF